MAPTMLNSPIMFVETYAKTDTNNNSRNNGTVPSDTNSIKV